MNKTLGSCLQQTTFLTTTFYPLLEARFANSSFTLTLTAITNSACFADKLKLLQF